MEDTNRVDETNTNNGAAENKTEAEEEEPALGVKTEDDDAATTTDIGMPDAAGGDSDRVTNNNSETMVGIKAEDDDEPEEDDISSNIESGDTNADDGSSRWAAENNNQDVRVKVEEDIGIKAESEDEENSNGNADDGSLGIVEERSQDVRIKRGEGEEENVGSKAETTGGEENGTTSSNEDGNGNADDGSHDDAVEDSQNVRVKRKEEEESDQEDSSNEDGNATDGGSHDGTEDDSGDHRGIKPEEEEDDDNDIFNHEKILRLILNNLGVLDLKRSACVNRKWRQVIEESFEDLDLLLVTVSGSNELALVAAHHHAGNIVQRIPIAAPRRRGGRRAPQKKRKLTAQESRQWPTCLTTNPLNDRQLFVSQYKIQGVLEFQRSSDGYEYRRTFLSGTKYDAPEGLVVAHNCLYICSAIHGTVTRISLTDGQLLEVTKAAPAADAAAGGDGDPFWVLWGMCISPNQQSLFIAGHISDHDESERPTNNNTGRILRLDLEVDGSFHKRPNGTPIGYYVDMPPQTHAPGGQQQPQQPLELNRPENPQFCRHGALHVSSFVSSAHGMQRRIHKLTCAGTPWQVGGGPAINTPLNLGWLEEEEEIDDSIDEEDDSSNTTTTRLRPWGIHFSNTSNEGYAVCRDDAQSRCLVRLATCGCENLIIQQQQQQQPEGGGSTIPRVSLNAWTGAYYCNNPGPISCGKTKTLVGNNAFQLPNQILPISS